MLALEHLNALAPDDFSAALADIYEHAPWVARQVASARPFATVAALHDAMADAIRRSGHDVQLTLLRAHPELGSKVARADITDHSRAEQGSLGLDRLSDAEFDTFQRLNAAYREKFGFPFIVCVRRHTRDSILAQFERRLGLSRDAEMETALAEVALIGRLRLVGKVTGPGLPKTDGRLSTHVLDTHGGRPAAGIPVRLYEVGASARGLVAATHTNADGRTDAPLIGSGPLRIGTYEIVFEVGAHFRAHGVALSDPPFLDVIPIRFSIADAEGHYHVPLLVTPWSFSTYRGS